jgi:hypothetical protein
MTFIPINLIAERLCFRADNFSMTKFDSSVIYVNCGNYTASNDRKYFYI